MNGSKVIHIVGHKNNGKTTLICELSRELTALGLKVGTLKHSSHSHELDARGKDSYLHRAAGGNPSAVVTTDQIGVFLSRKSDDNPLDVLEPLFKCCDIVLVEGYIEGPGKKIEVWRKENGTIPLAKKNHDIEAIVTDDDPLEIGIPIVPRKNIKTIIETIYRILGIKP